MKSRSRFCVLLLLLIGGSPITVPAVPAQTAAEIATIRRSYSLINRKQTRYKRIKKSLEGFSTEGGELVGYLDGKAIVKLIATFYGESGKALEEYYYHDGQLIFVYRKQSAYDKPLSGRVVSFAEQRLYFSGGRLLRWIDEKGRNVAGGQEYAAKEQEYLNSSREFLAGIRSSNPVIESSSN